MHLQRLGDEPREAYVTPTGWNNLVQYFQAAMPLCIRIGNVHDFPETGVVLRVMGSELMLRVDTTTNNECRVVGLRNEAIVLHDPEAWQEDGTWKELDKEGT
jgi:hypothetical protein